VATVAMCCGQPINHINGQQPAGHSKANTTNGANNKLLLFLSVSCNDFEENDARRI